MTIPNTTDVPPIEIYAEQLAQFQAGLEAWVAAGELSAETAPAARDFAAGVKKLRREIETEREDKKRPILDAGKKLDRDFKAALDPLDRVIVKIEKMLSDFARAERARLEAERLAKEKAARAAAEAAELEARAARTQAEKLVAEARAADAAALVKKAEAPVKVSVESATGLARTAGVRTERRARIVKPFDCLLHYRNHPEVLTLLEKLANADIRAAKGAAIQIPGVEIDEQERVIA